MAELNNIDFYDIIWGIVKYILIGIMSIFSMFFLYVFGKYRNQHEEMYKLFIENNGEKAKELKERENNEYKEIIEVIKELKHSVNQLRQDKTNMSSFAKQLERIEDDVHELKTKL